MRKFLFFLFLSVVTNCFVAKRSPFDTSTPTGAAMSIASVLMKGTGNSHGFVVENPIIFLAKGVETTFDFSGVVHGYTNFSISPPLPSEITLQADGTLKCTCPNNTPFQADTYTLTYSPKGNPNQTLTTTFQLYVYSPHVLITPNNGIADAEDLAPVVYKDKLYLFYKNTSDIGLKTWNGKNANDWTVINNALINGVSTSLNTLRARVYNDKIYIGFKGSSEYQVYSYDGISSNLVDNSSMSCGTCFDSAMEVFDNKLYVSYTDSQNNIYSSTGGDFASVAEISSIGSTPYTSLHTWNGKLWMAYTKNTGSPYYYLTNSDNWNSTFTIHTNASAFSYRHVALTSFQNRLYTLWVYNFTTIYLKSTADGSNFQDEYGGIDLGVGGGTVEGTSTLTFKNKLYIAFAQGQQVLYWTFDGGNWTLSDNLRVDDYSNLYAPRLFVWNGFLFLAWIENIGGTEKVFIRILE